MWRRSADWKIRVCMAKKFSGKYKTSRISSGGLIMSEPSSGATSGLTTGNSTTISSFIPSAGIEIHLSHGKWNSQLDCLCFNRIYKTEDLYSDLYRVHVPVYFIQCQCTKTENLMAQCDISSIQLADNVIASKRMLIQI